MAWDLFQWGSRGLWYTTGVEGIYMAHILIPGGIRVVLQTRDDQGSVLMNTMHVRVPDPPTSHEQCVAAAGVVKEWWDSQYRHLCNNQITGYQVIATATDAVPAFQHAIGLDTAGDRTGPAVTTSVTLAVKAQTGIAGRRHRGRVYLLPATMLDLEPLDPDLFIDSYRVAAEGVWNNLIGNFNTATLLMGVGSYADAKIYPIASFIAVDRNVDSQRRRLRGRGG